MSEEVGKLFLVTYNATIGRTKEDGADHDPVELIFHVTVRAPKRETVDDIVSNYSDKGFVAQVTNVVELADEVPATELHKLMAYATCVKG